MPRRQIRNPWARARFQKGGGGGMVDFCACTCKLPWTLSSRARVQPVCKASEKES